MRTQGGIVRRTCSSGTLIRRILLAARVGAVLAVLGGVFAPARQPDPVSLHRVSLRKNGTYIESMAVGGSDLLAVAFVSGRKVVRHSDNLAWKGVRLGGGTLHVQIKNFLTGAFVHEIALPDVTISPIRPEDGAELVNVRFSPDGKLLGVSYLSQIRLYEVGAWRQIATIGMPSEAAVEKAPSPRPKLQRPDVSAPPRPVSSWSERDGRTRVIDFAFTADSRHILASYTHAYCFLYEDYGLFCDSSEDDPLRLWDVPSGRLVWQKSYDRQIAKGRPVDDLLRFSWAMGRVQPSPDARVFASALGSLSSAIQIRSLLSGDPLYTLSGDEPGTRPEIQFSPDGSSFYLEVLSPKGPLGDKQRKQALRQMSDLAKFRTDDGAQKCLFPDVGGWTTALSHDGRWVVGPSRNAKGLRVADARTCQTIASVPIALGNWWEFASVNKVLISSDDQWVIAACPPLGWVAVYRVQH